MEQSITEAVDIENSVISYIKDKFLSEKAAENLTIETKLLDEQIIDSSGILRLIMYLEDKFSVRIDDEELIPENFNSIITLSSLVKRKLG